LVATKKLGVVIIAFWNDTYEQKIALLTTSISGRVILKEIVPKNLAILRETLKVDESKISEKDVQEAEAFLNQIPAATHEQFNVTDYRSELVVSEKVKQSTEKVQELEAILAKAS
jgi:hypothetical protein